MLDYVFRLHFGVLLVLALVCANRALAAGPLFPGAQYEVGIRPASVAVGDLNGDGWLDLTTANLSSADVSVLLNNGDGTYAAAVHYATDRYPLSVAVGDLNGDGWLDLAVANYGAYLEQGNVAVLLNNGDGTFGAPVLYGAGERPRSVAVGDLNNDQWPDLAVANGYDVSVLLNQSTTPGDVDGDGDVDRDDLEALLAAYGACEGDPNYDADADFDRNGCVNLCDLARLLSNYGAGR
jgi:hypothetical protein